MLNFQSDRFRPSKGKKPCETVVNLKATKAIGLDVPSLLVRADGVIE